MSASPRPITASPRSSVYVSIASPVSPRSESLGPAVSRSGAKACVPPKLLISTDTRCPTRLPQRAQNRSTPRVYAAPQELHAPGSAVAVVRVPQCPQKGSPGVTALPQRMQFVTASDTRVGGTTGLNGDGPRADE